MRRTWHYLDPLNETRGPIHDSQLARMLTVSDYMVWTEGMPGWMAASEYLARDGVAPLAGQGCFDLDPNGQPRQRGFNAELRMDRAVTELLGIVRGILFDGQVTDAEITALNGWFSANREVCVAWPASVLSARVRRVLEDGRVDEAERADLEALLRSVTGERAEAPTMGQALSTRLPLDDPEPSITFADSTFVFTGQFLFGTRGTCERAVVERGGLVSGNVTRKTRFLVIGVLGSRDWIQSTHGTKILKAIEYRDGGLPLSIVSEESWTKTLG